ncbi:hemerythrin domain-containing protein [Methylibium sp. Pch-M]|uniref:hemerythrin domain-containing protein n=1 Tax=Methylibium sp. Pch-M TaxID=2082386 RepID=UPI001F5D82E2|nr:hemerythrin domain-containing protein [Methylibium sp. Pch-M]
MTIIRQEHRALSAMLRAIHLMLGEHRRRGTLPDFGMLRAMLFYVDEFPERLHHAKESRLLFPMLRSRSAERTAVLNRLDQDHAQGEQFIRRLEHELLAFEVMAETPQGEERRGRFERSMTAYMHFYLNHMRTEEAMVLPMAERVLGDQDWSELDAAFLLNRDPLAGGEGDTVYADVFRRITEAQPTLLGLGSALEALAGRATARSV